MSALSADDEDYEDEMGFPNLRHLRAEPAALGLFESPAHEAV